MKGRTVASILRQVEEWHKELGREENRPTISWRRSPFKDFRWVEGDEALGNMRVWTITELLTNRALLVEGREMHHCVATYTDLCVSHRASIWSMQMVNRWGQRRVLTIDVDMPSKEIFEVRGRCNRMPSAGERLIVERWAAVEGLKVSEAIRM